MSEFKPGLYLVATPIGHMDDLSARARAVLGMADLVCAEDTRHYRHLLQAAQIRPVAQKVIAAHAHNEAEQAERVLLALQAGQRVAVVTDAGTPGIADPGQRLADLAWAHGFLVTPIPGPSALTAALSVCGFLPEDGRPWSFWGFLPARSHARRQRLGEIAATGGVCLVFESPHRLAESLDDCLTVLGPDTPTLLAKELTKRFETLWRGPLAALTRDRSAQVRDDPQSQKGEYVLVFSLKKPQQEFEGSGSVGWLPWLQALGQALPKSEAAKIVAQATGMPRQQAYAALLSVSEGGRPGQPEDPGIPD